MNAPGARYTGRMRPATADSPAATGSVDPIEVRKFDDLAHQFWDPAGAFKPLHALNPLRAQYVAERYALSHPAGLAQCRVLDVGCGGGLLAESLARRGALVTAIDMSAGMIDVARLHALDSGLSIDYRLVSAEQLATELLPPPGLARFDVITCMEMIEHVPDPAGLLRTIATLLRPGGDFFISTINRNLRSFLLAIVGAEYVLRLLPRGTHEYARLLRPSELATLGRQVGLCLRDIVGIEYNPLLQTTRLCRDVSVNYLAHLRLDSPA